MTSEEVTLWQKIKAFRIDDNQSSFTFSARLARENGWLMSSYRNTPGLPACAHLR